MAVLAIVFLTSGATLWLTLRARVPPPPSVPPLLLAHHHRPASHPRSPIRPQLSPRLLSSLMCAICYSNPPEVPPFRSFGASSHATSRRIPPDGSSPSSSSSTPLLFGSPISSLSSPSPDPLEPLAIPTTLAAPPPNSPLLLSPHETQDSP